MSDSGSLYESLGHSWTRDRREPWYTIELADGETWGFYGANLTAWHVLLGLELLHAVLSAMLSVVIYKLIIQKQGTWISYAVCYTVVPLVFIAPFQAFKLLDIRNQLFRFCIGTIMPVTCCFKTTAATYGFTPAYAKTSMKSFALFYATPMLMNWDAKLDKFVPITMMENLARLKTLLVGIIKFGFLKAAAHNFPQVIPPYAHGQPPADADWYKMSTLFHPANVLRNIMFAYYFQIMIQCFSDGLLLFQGVVTGYKTGEVMDNPLTGSRSLRQFWGSKWNLVVHDALKLGVYLPVRKFFPKAVAMLATFLASGAFHEVLLQTFTHPLDNKDGCFSDETAALTKVDCFSPRLFTTTWFFVWHAAWVAIEYSPIGQMEIWGKVPDPLATAYVLVVGSLFGHYFVEPYWNSLFFENASMFFFEFKPLSIAIE